MNVRVLYQMSGDKSIVVVVVVVFCIFCSVWLMLIQSSEHKKNNLKLLHNYIAITGT